MSRTMIRRSIRAMLALTALSMAVGWAAFTPASADDLSAKDLFKAMTTYLASQKSFSFETDTNLEIVTPDLQKIGFASSGSVTVARPDKIKMTRTGGFADVEMASDGKKLTLLGKNLNVFASIEAVGNIDELIDKLRSDYGAELPAADLLSPNADEIMMADVTSAYDLGVGVIGGKLCDHLAFRTPQTDWQIWIAEGEKPYPCRFEITSKLMAEAPSYRVDIHNWKSGQEVAETKFEIDPGNAKIVAVDQFSGLDELSEMKAEGVLK
jgi:hypothetical protein